MFSGPMLVQKNAGHMLAPVAETDFSRFQPQIYRIQNHGTFLWTVISENIGE